MKKILWNFYTTYVIEQNKLTNIISKLIYIKSDVQKNIGIGIFEIKTIRFYQIDDIYEVHPLVTARVHVTSRYRWVGNNER